MTEDTLSTLSLCIRLRLSVYHSLLLPFVTTPHHIFQPVSAICRRRRQLTAPPNTVKVNFSNTLHRPFGRELIPVYGQSARRWLFKSSLGCHYFLPGLRSPSQLKNVTVLRPVPSYTAWCQRHIGVNNLPKVVTQLCPGGNWTHDLLIASPTPYRYTTFHDKG